MKNFIFNMPTHVMFGAGQLAHLHEQKLPGKKALIITSNGQSAKKYGYLARTEKELELASVEHTLFDEIRPNPTRENVMDGARAVKENACDFVVALGGGSVMDCAKCIALMAVNAGDIWDYSLSSQGGKKTPEFDAIPIVAITTSAGTGSEVDIAAVISNDATKEKTGIFFPSMFPTISVVDPDLCGACRRSLRPINVWTPSSMLRRALSTKMSILMAEMFALKTIELIAKYLPVAYKDGSNKEARYYMAIANTLAGYYMNCTSAHTMEHVMGSYHEDLVHGAGLIMIAHAYYDFFAERKAAEEPMIKMAKAMGVENPTSGKDFIRALDTLLESIGCADLKMSEAGITREEMKLYPKRIHEVLGGDITADPLTLSNEDYLEIYEKSFQ